VSARKPNILPDGTWSMLPNYVVDSGMLRAMTKAQCRVYIALVLRTYWLKDGLAIVYQDQLEEATGIKARNIRTAVKGLVALGVVQIVSTGCGRGNATVYRIITENPDASIPLSTGETRMQDDTKGGCNAPQRGMQEVLNPDARIPPLKSKESKERERGHTATGVLDREQQETVQRLLDATRRGGAA
jgi:hypothetical protein